jgi:dihydrofolate synthase/folylpolyglutamate synthase
MAGLEKKMADRLESLYARRTFGIKLGLVAEAAILKALGNPERSFLPIHVAGTNGKGSVCAMLESVFRHAGLRTGLYTSPHLVRFNERIQVEGAPISDADLLSLWEAGETAERQAASGSDWQESTFFEFTTALAFEYFQRRRVQMGVVEVGMGGRLDATNVVTPLISVIAPVSLEHMEYLGRTVPAIAGEKCGIIKEGRPVVYAQPDSEAEAVVVRTARERGCRCVNALDAIRVERVKQDLDGQKVRIESETQSYGVVRLNLLGRHQLMNAALAVAAMEEAFAALNRPVPVEVVKAGLEAARWPGRLQILEKDPVTVLDGGHNPAAAAVLAAALKELAGRKPLGLICGMCGDKDLAGFFKPLAKRIKRVWAVRLKTPRSADPGQVAAQAQRLGLAAETADLAAARRAARSWALENGGAVCIAGSLFLAGEVLEMNAAALKTEGGGHAGD